MKYYSNSNLTAQIEPVQDKIHYLVTGHFTHKNNKTTTCDRLIVV